MFTRDADEPVVDVDSFFWRQVVAQSPLTGTPGTPYDDGWRATNRLLVSNGAQAQHERNVLLRNNGHGGFDEVSGTAGLDVDQDGRSFAVFDYDGDGDPDVVLLAPRSSPQLRLFRNDFAAGHAALALRLIGHEEQPRRHRRARDRRDGSGSARTRIVTGGLRLPLAALEGAAVRPGHEPAHRQGDDRVAERPGADPCRTPLGHRVWVEEGRGRRPQPSRSERARAAAAPPLAAAAPTQAVGAAPRHVALPSPFRRRTSRFATSTARSIRSRRWPASPRCCCSGPRGRRRRERRSRSSSRQREPLAAAGVASSRWRSTRTEDETKVRGRSPGPRACPC